MQSVETVENVEHMEWKLCRVWINRNVWMMWRRWKPWRVESV